MNAPLTVGAALARASAVLQAAGIGEARFEAGLLVGDVLGEDRLALLAYPERALDAARLARLDALVAGRARRRPMAQLLGRREFWSLEFAVSDATLIPRPDSETLVASALAWAAEREKARSPVRSVLDLGTGSGCLLLACLSEMPAARGLGIDRSPEALATARANAHALRLADRAMFCVGDWGSAIEQRFDLVLCNPPYIPHDALTGLEPEVARWEPAAALDGGADGLAAYRRVLPDIARLLAPGAAAVIEIGAEQAGPVGAIAAAEGLAVAATANDLAGRARCLRLHA